MFPGSTKERTAVPQESAKKYLNKNSMICSTLNLIITKKHIISFSKTNKPANIFKTNSKGKNP